MNTKKIVIVGSTHGHERLGLFVIEKLKTLNIKSDNVEFVIGNPVASKKNIPFVENDLNRVFPGKERGTYEEMRAFELSKKIVAADIVIDIHSTKTTDLGDQSMVIVTKYDTATKELLEVFKPPKVLHMKYKSDNALISQAKVGIAFEYGKDDSEPVLMAVLYDITQILLHYNIVEINPFQNPREIKSTETYEVFDVYKKEFIDGYILDKDVLNFVLVKKDSIVCLTDEGEEVRAEEDFYPILFGNNRYTDILGFRARKI